MNEYRNIIIPINKKEAGKNKKKKLSFFSHHPYCSTFGISNFASLGLSFISSSWLQRLTFQL